MPEITVTFEEHEARALLPQHGARQTPDEWNRRVDAAEDAQRKIRAALREVDPAPMEGQEELLA